jgi:hypothetical protein
MAEFRDNWIKAHEALQHSRQLLAQKDAELAQLRCDRNAADEAFRLSQELLAQKRSSARGAAKKALVTGSGGVR